MTAGANRLIVAAAGSGKTTFLVNEALNRTGRVLITTFTEANEQEIRNKIVEINHCIPPNITVQTWFSFLLQHGVRPFQGHIFDKRINGLLLASGRSGLKYTTKFNVPVYYSEDKEFENHYFTKGTKIFSDKLAKFVVRCNEKSNGAVIERMSKIYTDIYVDEVQDLAGFDLELLKLLFNSGIKILLAGDPRQGTYSTNNAAKNSQFKKAEIVHFFEDTTLGIETDDESLLVNWRCIESICDLSNSLYPSFKKTTSGNTAVTGHDGLYFIRPADVPVYLSRYQPMQLRDKITVQVNTDYYSLNFGESKGLSFNRVLIYPTKPIMDWLKDNSKDFAPTSRSKFYVAVTRARNSVGIVYDFDAAKEYAGFTKYDPNNA